MFLPTAWFVNKRVSYVSVRVALLFLQILFLVIPSYPTLQLCTRHTLKALYFRVPLPSKARSAPQRLKPAGPLRFLETIILVLTFHVCSTSRG